MSYVRRVHRFADCSGIPWQERSGRSEAASTVTWDVAKVTCGACKQRILNVILGDDWSALGAHVLLVLHQASDRVVVDDDDD